MTYSDKRLVVVDNTSYEQERFSSIPNLTKTLENKTLEQLQREGIFIFPETLQEAQDITRDQMVLQRRNNEYR